MATTYKVLGQVNPSATTATTAYTVPAASSAVVSTISVANLGGSSATFRVAIRPNGATLENKHYIAYDVSIATLDTLFITVGLTLDADDVITVYASTATMAFSIYGVEQ